jgi:predicted metal-binding protein
MRLPYFAMLQRLTPGAFFCIMTGVLVQESEHIRRTGQMDIDTLLQHALGLGVSDAKALSANAVSIEDRLADLCKEPRCPGYGQAANCPPHVAKPGAFRKQIEQYEHALVFKFDVPTEILLGDDRHEIARLVHETAASIERLALEAGFRKAEGLAGGSCKQLFCAEYADCRVLRAGGDCRFPDQARPSMSGFGVNVFELARAAGWQMNKITSESSPDDVPMGLMAGMVLIA